MGTSKPKVCKCGHDKQLHKHGKISLTSHCDLCKCNSYMNRNRPDKHDYGFMIFMLGFSIFFVGLSIVLISESDPALTGTENEPINMTTGELHYIMVLLFIAINAFFVIHFCFNPILDILLQRRRYNFPIAENTNLD